ncbi:MAG: hypothetical protein WCL27_14105 [Betaproteobacteria bacterium]
MDIEVAKGEFITLSVATGAVFESIHWTGQQIDSEFIGMDSLLAPVFVTRTRNTDRQELWIREDDGNEIHVEFLGQTLPVTQGQRVSMVMARKKGQSDRWYYLGLNHSTGRYVNCTTAETKQSLGFPLISLTSIENGLLAGIAGAIICLVGLADLFGRTPLYGLPYLLAGALGVWLFLSTRAKQKNVEDNVLKVNDAAVQFALSEEGRSAKVPKPTPEREMDLPLISSQVPAAATPVAVVPAENGAEQSSDKAIAVSESLIDVQQARFN